MVEAGDVRPGDQGGNQGGNNVDGQAIVNALTSLRSQPPSEKDVASKTYIGIPKLADALALALNADAEPAMAMDPYLYGTYLFCSTEARSIANGGAFSAQWTLDHTALSGTMCDHFCTKLTRLYNVQKDTTFTCNFVLPVVEVLHDLAQTLVARDLYLIEDPSVDQIKSVHTVLQAFNLREKLGPVLSTMREAYCERDENAPQGDFLNLAGAVAYQRRRNVKGQAGAFIEQSISAAAKDGGRMLLRLNANSGRPDANGLPAGSNNGVNTQLTAKQTRAQNKAQASARVYQKKIKALESEIKKAGKKPLAIYKAAKVFKKK